MPNLGSNQVLLTVFLLLVVGAGTYLTYFRQEATLNELQTEIEAKEQELLEIRALRSDLQDGEEALRGLRTEWAGRYRVVPDTLTSADLIDYFATHTRTGFKRFNVTSEGRAQNGAYSTYTFSVEGKAFFTSLYRFVWTMENNRPFYRIRDLSLNYQEERTTDEESGRTRMDLFVGFQMDVQAVYGLVEDLPGPQGEDDLFQTADRSLASMDTPPSLPLSVVPAPVPDINPFYPLIFEEVPPNEEGRLNLDTAQLISIVDGRAVFETGRGLERLTEGDRVYLGRIVEVDAAQGRVRARLNRGGIIDEVVRTLDDTSPLQRTDATP